MARRDDVREAALRPLHHSGRMFWVLVIGLAALVVWGVVAYIVQLANGLGAAGYSDTGFWGIYEANLVAFIAVSYGGALVSAILRLTQAHWRAPITRLSEAMAVFSLLVGMAFALIHLGNPANIWRMVVAPQVGSPIVWDFVVIMTYLVATLVFLYLPLVPDLAILRDGGRFTARRARMYRTLALGWRNLPDQRRYLDRGITTIAILIIPIAILVHSVLSWAFALTGRPGWDSTIFAPYFVVGALYSGVAMVILVVAGFRAGYRLQRFIDLKHFQYLGYLMLTLDLMYLYFTFTELLTEGYVQTEEVAPVLEALLVGTYAPSFWFFIVAWRLAPPGTGGGAGDAQRARHCGGRRTGRRRDVAQATAHRRAGRCPSADRGRLGYVPADVGGVGHHRRRGGGYSATADAVLQVLPDPVHHGDGGSLMNRAHPARSWIPVRSWPACPRPFTRRRRTLQRDCWPASLVAGPKAT